MEFIFGEDVKIIMACNTAHLLVPQLGRNIRKHLVSLIDLTIAEVEKKEFRKVGILASPLTVKTGLFSDQLHEIGLEMVLPSKLEENILERLIRAVIANQPTDKLRVSIKKIVKRMQVEGCEAVILGCTELSVIVTNRSLDNTIDPLELAVKELLK